MLSPQVEYISDDEVDAALDAALRHLLSLCFTGSEDFVFKERRYFREPPSHRWIVRDAGAAIAHIAVHEKVVIFNQNSHPIGGIAEVCVHPDHRHQGYVKRILSIIHPWLAKRGFEYAVLFGEPGIYGSSGYVQVTNLVHDAENERGEPYRRSVIAMVQPLGDRSWFDGEVYLPGKTF